MEIVITIAIVIASLIAIASLAEFGLGVILGWAEALWFFGSVAVIVALVVFKQSL